MERNFSFFRCWEGGNDYLDCIFWELFLIYKFLVLVEEIGEFLGFLWYVLVVYIGRNALRLIVYIANSVKWLCNYNGVLLCLFLESRFF